MADDHGDPQELWMSLNEAEAKACTLAQGYLTRRMVSCYEAGLSQIPRMVCLACNGWEEERAARTR